ncbi:hypothetical protein EsH8_I_000764 [Colletotrichum jinshuiense]
MATATTFSTDPALWIFTSLTAGSSHIVTATSRLETILRANRVPFKAIDIATDDKARMLWGRRAGKDASGRVRKLPGLVQEGLVLGDLVEIEEWNEYGELKQHVKIYYDEYTIPDINNKPKEPIKKKIIKKVPKGTLSGSASTSASAPPPAPPLPKAESSTTAAAKDKAAEPPKVTAGGSATLAHRSIADEAAKKAKELRSQSLRDKVYGKKDAKGEKAAEEKKPETGAPAAATTPAEASTTEPEKKTETTAAASDAAATQATPRKTSVTSISSGPSIHSAKPPGLQSPTTGSWGASTATNPDALRETLQSPTTARWKPSDVDKPVTVHMGAAVASASQEEIAAVEKAETIEEEPESEDSDDEVSQKKIEAVEKAEAIKEEPEKEEVEDDTKAAAPQKEIAAVEKTVIPKEQDKKESEEEDSDDDDDEDSDESEDSEDDDDDDASESETKTDDTKAKLGTEVEAKKEAKAEESKK